MIGVNFFRKEHSSMSQLFQDSKCPMSQLFQDECLLFVGNRILLTFYLFWKLVV